MSLRSETVLAGSGLLQGSKIRASYIAFAQKEKKRIEDEVSKFEQEIAAREKEVARLKGAYPS